MIVGVDFDGTVVEHRYPLIGPPVPDALEVIQGLRHNNHYIILWTMRSGEHLEDAVQYMRDNGVYLFGINENPSQHTWSQSPKAYCHIYIDDAALGCPLVYTQDGRRPYVSWSGVRMELRKRGLL